MTGTESGSRLLLVAGMHRSGTSALCAALEAAGVSFGAELLDPMAGVNDEGFWEDAAVVALNEALLERIGLSWFSVPSDLTLPDWAGPRFDDCRDGAQAILRRGFGDGAVQAVKDPRFCLTLGFWLDACRRAGIAVTVAVISRTPLDVAASLERRDGLPLSVGLRLYLGYYRALFAQLPTDAFRMTFDQLLRDPAATLAPLLDSLGISGVPDFREAVRADLQHHRSQGDDPLRRGVTDAAALEALDEAIELEYPQALADSLEALVARGRELTRVGDLHSSALATVKQRDGEIGQLTAELRAAVATVVQRDAEIEEFDRRLGETGEHLGQALETIAERDRQITELDQRLTEEGRMHRKALDHIEALEAQLQRLFATPGLGRLIRRLWDRAGR